MCLLIVKKAGGRIKEEYLEEAFKSNSDGAGFFVAGIMMKKGFFKVDDVLEFYKEHEEHPMIIHFRLSTSGLTDSKNCHPFKVGPFWMGHNGIIRDYETSETYCDSAMLAKDLDSIVTENPDVVFTDGFSSLLKKIIGLDKLAFMNRDGKFRIINSKQGHWDEGVWFSNSSYKTYQYTSYKYDPNKVYNGYYAQDEECEICSYPMTGLESNSKMCSLCEGLYGDQYAEKSNETTSGKVSTLALPPRTENSIVDSGY